MGNELDLTGDGGVLKTTTRKAKADAIGPTTELSIVDVHLKALFPETGKVISNTRKDRMAYLKIGENHAIKGLDIALRTMKVGEKATITCKPAYAYGSAGSPPDIPPNATLIFKVEIMGWRHRESANPGRPTDDVPSIEVLKEWFSTPAGSGEEEEGKKYLEQKKEKMSKMREAEVEGGIYELSSDGGVTKEIVKKAGADAIGPTEDLRIVVVRYHSGTALTRIGESIASSFEGNPELTIEIGTGDAIIGWDIALRTMRVGDIAKITCKPEYTYGKDGFDPEPDVTLISSLEVMACRHWTSPTPGSPSKEESRVEWEREVELEWDKWEEATADQQAEQWSKGAIGAGIVARVRAKLDQKNSQRTRKNKRKAENESS